MHGDVCRECKGRDHVGLVEPHASEGKVVTGGGGGEGWAGLGRGEGRKAYHPPARKPTQPTKSRSRNEVGRTNVELRERGEKKAARSLAAANLIV